MESLLDFIEQHRAQLQQDPVQKQLDWEHQTAGHRVRLQQQREHQVAMMRTFLESQKSTFKLSPLGQGATASGGNTPAGSSTVMPRALVFEAIA